ncbi:MAG: hypothetical protein JW996_01600 [Candidatus Cloacimonetes bacterium]|nr:hypothetical protein [Candidatus Cloacimonadota bacterium]
MIFILILIISFVIGLLFYRKTVPEIDSLSKLLLVVLRSISLAIVLLLLLNPILYLVRIESVKPLIILLKDRSASMELMAKDEPKTEIISPFEDKIHKLYGSRHYNLQEYDFADGIDGDTGITNLTKTMEELIKKHGSRDLKQIFLSSDGWFKDTDLSILDEINVPVTCYDPQINLINADLEISNISHNKSTYKDEITPVIIDIYAEGYRGSAELLMVSEGKILKKESVDFKNSGFQQLVLEHEFEGSGLIPFSIEIKADSLVENNNHNNNYPSAIQVLDSRLKAIVISDKLNWDTRFILSSLKDDNRWESISLVKDNAIFLKGREIVTLSSQLENTVLMILINGGNLTLDNAELGMLTQYLQNGGGLCFFGKIPENMTQILPAKPTIIKDRFDGVLQFTSKSLEYNTFSLIDKQIQDNIPPVSYYYVTPRLEAQVLAIINNEQQTPAVIFSHYEQGKVLYFSFLHLWKWQLWTGENHYREFISNICQWIGQRNSERFYAFPERNSYFAGETVRIYLKAYDEKLIPVSDLNARIKLFDQTGKMATEKYMISEVDDYLTELSGLEAGDYSFSIIDDQTGQEASGEFIVSAANPESRDQGFNLSILSYISELTGGKIYDPQELESMISEDFTPREEELKTEIPIYKKWYLIAIFIIVFSLELYLRKRWGLL